MGEYIKAQNIDQNKLVIIFVTTLDVAEQMSDTKFTIFWHAYYTKSSIYDVFGFVTFLKFSLLCLDLCYPRFNTGRILKSIVGILEADDQNPLCK